MTVRGLSSVLTVLLALAALGWARDGMVQPGAGRAAEHLAVTTRVADDQEGERREADGEPLAISAIDSPSPTCYRPVAGTGACYIQWNYMYVTASASSYVISMTVAIDNRIRSYHSGFFQASMYLDQALFRKGFRVVCGFPGSGGSPEMGKSYSYTVRARDAAGTSAANFGSVICPADVVKVYLPIIVRQ